MTSISVIIPYYNRAACLGRCIDSVYRQSHRPVELILVDNASDDGGPDVCRSLAAEYDAPDFRVKLLEAPCRGACQARNTGLEAATGDRVLFFDSDDEMLPEMLSSLCAAADAFTAETGEAPDIVACRSRHDDGKIYPKQLTASPARHLVETAVVTHNVCLKRDFARAVGPWNTALRRWQDLEYGFRLLLQASSTVWVDKPLYKVHDSADAISAPSWIESREALFDTIHALGEDIEEAEEQLSDDEQARLITAMAFRMGSLAAALYRDGDRVLAEKCHTHSLQTLPPSHQKYRPLLALHYAYTKRGGRGFWRVFRCFV